MLQTIEGRLAHLSRAELKVGQWILAHPREALHAAVADVASAANTSQPTVIRFCRSIGVSGFRELKIRLAESIGRPASYLHRDVNPDDTTGEAAGKVLDRAIQSLVDLRSTLNALPLNQAVVTLAKARQIVFVGSGASGHVAHDACHKFFRLGMPCISVHDVPTMLQYSAIAGARDVFVMISQTGRSTGVVQAAAAAHAAGADVIAITDATTPLAAAAKILLTLPSPEDASVFTPMSSRLAQLALLDTLQVALALQMGPASETKLLRSKQALGQMQVAGTDQA